MITRAKLVEQLREHQIRSAQSYSAALAVFSPNPHIASSWGLGGIPAYKMSGVQDCAKICSEYLRSVGIDKLEASAEL